MFPSLHMHLQYVCMLIILGYRSINIYMIITVSEHSQVDKKNMLLIKEEGDLII